MVTLTQEQLENLWIVSMVEDEESHSNGCTQSWGSWPPPENYAYIEKDGSEMQEYYKKTDVDGNTLKSAGHVDLTYDDCECEGKEGTCKIVTGCTFNMDKYNAYQNSLPNPIPGIVESKIAEAQNKADEMAAQGIAINSMNLATTFVNLDGVSNPETDALMYYNKENREEILKAFMACRSGLDNYTLRLSGKAAVQLPAELIYRMYIELETFIKMQNCYSEVYIKFLASHKNDDRSQENVINGYTYGETELPAELQTELETAQEGIMTEMQTLAEKLGITE